MVLLGVEGNGQRELVEVIMGLLSYDDGEVLIKGQSNKGLTVTKIRDIGVGYIPEDRHHRAVVLLMTVLENAVLGLVRKAGYSKMLKLFKKNIKKQTQASVAEYDIRLGSIDQAIYNLSGGNQ